MSKYVYAYLAAAIVMIALDVLWLGVVAKPFYARGIGHLMADKPNFIAATLFYLMFAVGIVYFAIAPHIADAEWSGWRQTLISAALFGFFAYATYDLTNLATLRDWPVSVALADMAWGTLASVVAAASGKFAIERIAAI